MTDAMVGDDCVPVVCLAEEQMTYVICICVLLKSSKRTLIVDILRYILL